MTNLRQKSYKMSKIEQLLEKLCPDGVEYDNFGNLAKIVRGASPDLTPFLLTVKT